MVTRNMPNISGSFSKGSAAAVGGAAVLGVASTGLVAVAAYRRRGRVAEQVFAVNMDAPKRGQSHGCERHAQHRASGRSPRNKSPITPSDSAPD